QELNNIITYATSHEKTICNPSALCIEVKTAWVEAESLRGRENTYITMCAEIPTFDKSDPKRWTQIPKGNKKVKLALVGMNIAGSAKGHPEMIWAAFEHFGNTPNAAFTFYQNGQPDAKSVAMTTKGEWLFCKSGAIDKFNCRRQVM